MTKISYELAKELKEAGYPQKDGAYWILLSAKQIKNQKTGEWFFRNSHWSLSPHIVRPIKGLNRALDYAHVPTLSELIAACGKSAFDGLWCRPKQTGDREISDWWFARANADVGEVPPEGNGASPKEAVARLYIALQASHN